MAITAEKRGRNKRYYEENRERLKAEAARRRAARDPEEAREYRRLYYEAHADERREASRRWRSENPLALAQANREYLDAHRDERAAYLADWRRRNPEKAWVSTVARRALKKQAAGDPVLLAEYVATLRSDPCAYCGGSMEHIDHVDPLARGGAHEWENLAPACASCNGSKHAKSLLVFLAGR